MFRYRLSLASIDVYRHERLAVLDDAGARAVELDDGPDAQRRGLQAHARARQPRPSSMRSC